MKQRLRIILPVILLLLISVVAITTSTTTAQVATGVTYGSDWLAEYYNNTTFSGTAVNTQIGISQINFNYGANSPFNFVNADNFGIRFSTAENFGQGEYKFTAQVNDGVKVTVDGIEIINDLSAASSDGTRVFTRNVVIAAGQRNIVVEMVEYTGNAAIQFFWEPVNVIPSQTAGPSPTPTATGLPPIPPGVLTATVIRAGVLNTRTAPSLGGGVVKRILRGQTYAVVGRDPDARWFLLELGDVQAWAYGYYLYVNGNEFTAPIRSATTVFGIPHGFNDTGVLVQTCATMKLRAEPNILSEQTGRITWGSFLPVATRSPAGDWYQVLWKGTVGWMYSGFSKVVQGDYSNVPVTQISGLSTTVNPYPPFTNCRSSGDADEMG